MRQHNILRKRIMHANGIFLFALKASFFHYSLTSSAFTLILQYFEGLMSGKISELMIEITAAVSFGFSYIFQSLIARHLFSFVILNSMLLNLKVEGFRSFYWTCLKGLNSKSKAHFMGNCGEIN